MKATFSISYERNDGVTVARSVNVLPSAGETAGKFKARVKRRAMEAVSSVLGTPKGVTVDAG